MNRVVATLVGACLGIGFFAPMVQADAQPPLKVFVLAGQSNMQGHAALETVGWLGQDPQHGHLLKKLKRDDGGWTVRDDVWIYYPRNERTLKTGKLTVGFGARDDKLGPELMFGQIIGDHFDEQVLLIKAAWGGKSLAVDFRPPSAGGTVGPYYERMIAIVKQALDNLEETFPAYDGQGYELAGFVWFQGWNDMINAERVAEYESNLVHLIKDLRRDLDAPDLPVVIGELGVGGEQAAEKNPRMAGIRRAQAAPAERAEFRETVVSVPTWKFWDHEAADFLAKHWIKRKWTSEEARRKWQTMGSQPPYHYLGSAKVYSLIGYNLALAMIDLHSSPD